MSTIPSTVISIIRVAKMFEAYVSNIRRKNSDSNTFTTIVIESRMRGASQIFMFARILVFKGLICSSTRPETRIIGIPP